MALRRSVKEARRSGCEGVMFRHHERDEMFDVGPARLCQRFKSRLEQYAFPTTSLGTQLCIVEKQ